MSNPNLNRFSDGHVHTKLCLHASGEMDEYVQSAINKGLTEIIFLEHMEEGIDTPYRSWLTEDDFDLFFTEIDRLKKAYSEQITIKAGVELGYNPACHDTLMQRLASRKWDKIGLSYHFFAVPGEQHINLLSRMKDNHARARQIGIDLILKRYFADIIQAVEVIPADTLCHLDAPLRHLPETDISGKYIDLSIELLRAVKAKGMNLEINTSGFKYRNDPFPSEKILQAAKEMDINYVLGSDAHTPQDVGRYFEEAEQLLAESHR